MIDIFEELTAVIQSRKEQPTADSYTAQLFAKGEDEILKKIGEEAVEVILAAKSQGQPRLIEETADLFYHLTVLLVANDLSWLDVVDELERRRTTP